MFIRVRSAAAPLHEFDVPVVTFEHHPDRYEVVEKKPVARQRPASHFPGVMPDAQETPAKPKRARSRKAAPKTGEDNTAPSVGPIPEEDA